LQEEEVFCKGVVILKKTMQAVICLELQICELARLGNDLIDLLTLVAVLKTYNVYFAIVCQEQVLLTETNVADYKGKIVCNFNYKIKESILILTYRTYH
jgi:DNA invertase Pin-like site-specific DNA recombinase